MLGVDRGRADHDLGAEGAEQLRSSPGDLVGHREDAAVAALAPRPSQDRRRCCPRSARRSSLRARARPSRSAASIIASAGRSLTLPPGLRYSSLASRWHHRSLPAWSIRSIGVPPISSIRLSTVAIGAPGSVSGRTSTPVGGGTSSSAKSMTGRPPSRTASATGTPPAPSPTTPTRRGMPERSSATSAGMSPPEAWTTRPERASSLDGGFVAPTTTRTSITAIEPDASRRPARPRSARPSHASRRGGDGAPEPRPRRRASGAPSAGPAARSGPRASDDRHLRCREEGGRWEHGAGGVLRDGGGRAGRRARPGTLSR